MARKSDFASGIDWTLVLIYLVLVFMGWMNIYAAVFNEEHYSIFDLTQRYGMQLIWIAAAVVLAIFTLAVDGKFYYVFAYALYALSILLLLSVFVLGKEVNGAKSWIFIRGVGGIQPAEFVKVTTVLALARLMSSYDFTFKTIRGYLKVGALLGLPMLIILVQPDVGSVMVFMALTLMLYREGMSGWVLVIMAFAAILFILTLKLSMLAIMIGLVVIGLAALFFLLRKGVVILGLAAVIATLSTSIFFLVKAVHLEIGAYVSLVIAVLMLFPFAVIYALKQKIRSIFYILVFFVTSAGLAYSVDYVFDNVLEPHHQSRIKDLLGIESDPLGWGYNLNQSKVAIGSGGFLGKGFLQGTQTKYNFVPEQSTDFIFCTVGEEWGFVGSAIVISLFVVLLFRIQRTAERQKQAFARMYGYGVLSILFFHLVVNIAMTIGLFPVIGIPLPFFSYGGSSLWSFTVLLFVFIKISSDR
ncbi:rod shape-determining protein RodA [Williamwhitmania taraxaci]|uniref:Cell wall polymerase n=1 Tax=Williamwhitmania taraxaci TaxID=1640674 RepID=A0A1G6HZU4_9BACT|nr:rod shape-determining protein RodA [Williamwhitmania taraxaci]SDB99809.1 rod shape determining protein RodA [Williamwhitmania taraxaci]